MDYRHALLMLCCSAVTARSTFGDALSLEHEGILSPAYTLRWQLDAEDIILEVEVKTKGWIGLGFSSKGDMLGADIILMWVEGGQAFVEDRHSPESSMPLVDESQDVFLVSGSESDGVTTVRVRRKLRPCDDDDRPISDDAMRVLFAYGDEDPVDGFFNKHEYQKRSHKTLYLLEPKKQYAMDDDAFTVDIMNNDVIIPHDKGTTYWCTVRPAPKLTSKHHAIAFEAVIPEHKHMLHHIALMACLDPTFDVEHWASQPEYMGHECNTPEMPSQWATCLHIIYIWTVGAGIQKIPDHIGYPFGEEDSPTYFVLETHYDNYEFQEGVVDNSGIRMYLTPTPRQEDMGMITFGMHFVDWFVPPLVKDMRTEGHCLGECTKEFLPKEGISVYAYMIHAHYLGRKIYVHHYRDGNELEPIALEDNYDFDFQVVHQYEEPRIILPGDELKITCEMESNRTNSVLGGIDSFKDEMCVGFLYYWPKVPISECATMPSHAWLPSDPLWEELSIEPVNDTNGKIDLFSTLDGVKWNKKMYDAVQNSYYEGTHKAICTEFGTVNQYDVNDKHVRPQPVSQEWVDDQECFEPSELSMSAAQRKAWSSLLLSLPLLVFLLC